MLSILLSIESDVLRILHVSFGQITTSVNDLRISCRTLESLGVLGKRVDGLNRLASSNLAPSAPCSAARRSSLRVTSSRILIGASRSSQQLLGKKEVEIALFRKLLGADQLSVAAKVALLRQAPRGVPMVVAFAAVELGRGLTPPFSRSALLRLSKPSQTD